MSKAQRGELVRLVYEELGVVERCPWDRALWYASVYNGGAGPAYCEVRDGHGLVREFPTPEAAYEALVIAAPEVIA